MEEQIKILRDDIIGLIDMVEKERNYRQEFWISGSERMKQIYDVESDDNKDYNAYKKLIDTILQNFLTYRRLLQSNRNKENDNFEEIWLEKEIEITHTLMVGSKNRENYDQYRCLNYVYVKLLNELHSVEMSKPIKINNDITIEVENRTLPEVLEDISLAWNRLNGNDRDKVGKIILEK